MKPIFNVEIESIIINHSIEISKELLLWILKQDYIFDKFLNVEYIDKDSVEYDAHFGPYIFFSCELKNTLAVSRDILKILKNCNRNMKRNLKKHEKQI